MHPPQIDLYVLRECHQSKGLPGGKMIRLVVEMSDKTYRNLKNGIDVGLFTVSLRTLEDYGVNIVDKRVVE
jgi:hypothetical protein